MTSSIPARSMALKSISSELAYFALAMAHSGSTQRAGDQHGHAHHEDPYQQLYCVVALETASKMKDQGHAVTP